MNNEDLLYRIVCEGKDGGKFSWNGIAWNPDYASFQPYRATEALARFESLSKTLNPEYTLYIEQFCWPTRLRVRYAQPTQTSEPSATSGRGETNG